jgi:hypothetical protein|tara:strand:+ start:1469 stop:1684 length:216 start_codon:yes stop_codon:yes gene_type:complete
MESEKVYYYHQSRNQFTGKFPKKQAIHPAKCELQNIHALNNPKFKSGSYTRDKKQVILHDSGDHTAHYQRA